MQLRNSALLGGLLALLLSPLPAQAGSFTDTFDDGVVSPWKVLNGTITESGSALNESGFTLHVTPSAVMALGVPTDSTVHFMANVKINNGGFGFTMRRNGNDWCGFFFWAGSAMYIGSDDVIETGVASPSFPLGTTLKFEGEITGNSITGWINGVKYGPFTNSYCNFTGSGEIGILNHQDTNNVVYDFNANWTDADKDGDGYCGGSACTDATKSPNDCNDADASINPGAAESCDGKDNDCDSAIDEGVKSTYYQDADGDGYGSSTSTQAACAIPSGYVTNATDCKDSDKNVYPGATEKCNGIDDDCDSVIDEDVKSTYWQDADGDSYGNPGASTQACSSPSGYVTNKTDCNDASAISYPGAKEICDDLDNDCNGVVDDGLRTTYYKDLDGDGYGNPASTTTACSLPSGYSSNNLDCKDTNDEIHPGATEACNGIDDDCDGVVDDNAGTVFYQDSDGDRYGNVKVSKQSCTTVSGYVVDSTDCDDSNAKVHPGATEIPYDGVDNDCVNGDEVDVDDDGFDADVVGGQDCDDEDVDVNPDAEEEPYDGIDNDCADGDETDVDDDGYTAAEVGGNDCDDDDAGINPASAEVCADGVDQDCDGVVDDGFDQDKDGHLVVAGCEAAGGDDCDDTYAATYAGAPEICDARDNDCDSQVDEDFTDTDHDGTADCLDDDVDGDTYAAAQDCNDQNASINPAAIEVCDGVDQDCDGIIDDGFDKDGDLYLDATACASVGGSDCNDGAAAVNPGATEACGDGVDNDCKGGDLSCDDVDNDGDGVSENQGDCDDTSGQVNPKAIESCNGVDDDCDDQVDEGFGDLDGDGEADCVDTDKDGDTYAQDEDCVDTDASIHPEATEVCDGADQDCDGSTDEGFDQDGDGHLMVAGCESAGGDDCDDAWAYTYAGATEQCDGRDNDCDNQVDEDFSDADGDGTADCLDEDVDGDSFPAASDCDDSDASIHPEATEVCDGADQDCDGTADDGFDQDGDGHLDADACADSGSEAADDCDDQDAEVHPGASEACNGLDEDCDGSVDEGFDADGDGASTCPGDGQQEDCDDADGDVYPGADEECGNGIDEDCSGQDADCDSPTPEPTATPEPTDEPTPEPTDEPTATPEPSASPTPDDGGDTPAGDDDATDGGGDDTGGGCNCRTGSSLPESHGGLTALALLGFAALALRRRYFR